MAVNRSRKKKIVVKVPTKKIKKEIRTLRRGLKKEIARSSRISKTVSKTAAKQGSELELLKREIEKLKKRRKKSSLSAYNRFMRSQIKKGLSFKQAAKLWRRQKKAEAKKARRRTGYNAFISIQLKQGKNMKQAIRAWNLLKKPKSKRRAAKKKIVQKKVLARKTRRRKAVAKVSADAVSKMILGAMEKVRSDAEKREGSLKELFSKRTAPGTAKQTLPEKESDEEIALRMLDIYFKEVARRGLKRTLSLDEVVNAYFYSLMRIQRKDVELQEICKVAAKM